MSTPTLRFRLVSIVVTLCATSTAPAQRVAMTNRPSDRAFDLLSRPARLVISNVRLEVGLSKLQQTSGVPLAFSPDFLPGDRTVSCQCQVLTLREALDSLLVGTRLRYLEIRGQVLIERPKPGADRGLESIFDGSSPVAVVVSAQATSRGWDDVSVVPPVPQGVTLSGVVVSNRSTPIRGARVVIAETKLEALTDGVGRFRIANVTGSEVTLHVTMIGYRPVNARVRVADPDLRVTMTEMPINLSEIVVTGTAGGVQRRALGNSVSTVDAAQVIDEAPASTVGQLVNGRAPGVVVVPASGMVGSGPIIRIRGTGSLSLNLEPLVYVDGVRADNTVRTGPDFQGAPVISRLGDLNPDDIESIEIIKGPAAATLYGTEASNGVIQIITKRGKANQPASYSLSVRQGANWFMNPEGRIPPNYLRLPSGDVFKQDLVAQENARGTPIFRRGWVQAYDLNVSGGSDVLRYYLGGGFDDDEGVLEPNRNRRMSGRTNLTIAPNPKLEITTSAGFVHQNTTLAAEDGTGVPNSLIFGDPRQRDTPRRGFRDAPPEVFPQAFDLVQKIDRFTGSLQLNHRPTSWLNHRLTVGVDQVSENNHALVQRDASLEPFFGSEVANGSKSVQRFNRTATTLDYSATASFELSKKIRSQTSVGGQYYRNFVESFAATGLRFPASGLKTVTSAAFTTGGDDFVENVTLGTYVQQQFALNDRLFLTGAVRADDNSAFGGNFDLATYPKVSLAWVVSEEPFWHLGFINTLKIRSAFGASGQQPDAFAALRTYQPVPGEGGLPAVTTGLPGNPDLAPERGEEFEAGIEASLFNNRVGIDFTFYNKDTKNAILLRRSAPSGGFATSQFVNVGKLRNRGFELLLKAVPIESRSTNWELDFTLSRNDNKILDMGEVNSISLSADVGRHTVGFPVAAFFARKIVSADFDAATGRAINLMCDGGEGNVLPCAEASKIFVGRRDPLWEGAVNSSLTFLGRLRLHAQVDFKTGYKIFGVDHWNRCAVVQVCEEAVFPERFDPVFIANLQNAAGFGFVDAFISDASFAKLRELSLSYSLPRSWARIFGASRATATIAGRNLHTWTSYDGALDPEGLALRFTDINVAQAQLPQLAQFLFSFNVSF